MTNSIFCRYNWVNVNETILWSVGFIERRWLYDSGGGEQWVGVRPAEGSGCLEPLEAWRPKKGYSCGTFSRLMMAYALTPAWSLQNTEGVHFRCSQPACLWCPVTAALGTKIEGSMFVSCVWSYLCWLMSGFLIFTSIMRLFLTIIHGVESGRLLPWFIPVICVCALSFLLDSKASLSPSRGTVVEQLIGFSTFVGRLNLRPWLSPLKDGCWCPPQKATLPCSHIGHKTCLLDH